VRRLKIDRVPVTELEATLTEAHRVAREPLAEFLIVPKSRVLIFALHDSGFDVEITNLCRSLEPEWMVAH
jgi:hypothetical protein